MLKFLFKQKKYRKSSIELINEAIFYDLLLEIDILVHGESKRILMVLFLGILGYQFEIFHYHIHFPTDRSVYECQNLRNIRSTFELSHKIYQRKEILFNKLIRSVERLVGFNFLTSFLMIKTIFPIL